MLGIINYGMGNLASVQNALDYLNIPSRIIDQPSEVRKCGSIILPGVGAFGVAIQRIRHSGFFEELHEHALVRKRPLLGICLGMQLLLDSSTEHGNHEGLALVRGTVESLHDSIKELPIPHVGWNTVTIGTSSLLLSELSTEASFYFVHSYYCRLTERPFVTGRTSYGIEFDAVFEAGNIFGVQFHPEKSQKSGLSLLKKFGTF